MCCPALSGIALGTPKSANAICDGSSLNKSHILCSARAILYSAKEARTSCNFEYFLVPPRHSLSPQIVLRPSSVTLWASFGLCCSKPRSAADVGLLEDPSVKNRSISCGGGRQLVIYCRPPRYHFQPRSGSQGGRSPPANHDETMKSALVQGGESSLRRRGGANNGTKDDTYFRIPVSHAEERC